MIGSRKLKISTLTDFTQLFEHASLSHRFFLPLKVFLLFDHPAEPHDHQLLLLWSAGHTHTVTKDNKAQTVCMG